MVCTCVCVSVCVSVCVYLCVSGSVVHPAAVTQAKSRAAIFTGKIRNSLLHFDDDNFSVSRHYL